VVCLASGVAILLSQVDFLFVYMCTLLVNIYVEVLAIKAKELLILICV